MNWVDELGENFIIIKKKKRQGNHEKDQSEIKNTVIEMKNSLQEITNEVD